MHCVLPLPACQLSGTSTLEVLVLDENDNNPVFERAVYSGGEPCSLTLVDLVTLQLNLPFALMTRSFYIKIRIPAVIVLLTSRTEQYKYMQIYSITRVGALLP